MAVKAPVAAVCPNAAAVGIAAVTLSQVIPLKMAEKLGDQAEAAGLVVLFLGLGLAVQMVFDACRGIITGSHKWTVHNAINAGSYSVSSVLMIIAFCLAAYLMGRLLPYDLLTQDS